MRKFLEDLLTKRGWHESHPAGFWDHEDFKGKDTLLFDSNDELVVFSLPEDSDTDIEQIKNEEDLIELMTDLKIK